MIEVLLPAVARERLASACDAFVAATAFGVGRGAPRARRRAAPSGSCPAAARRPARRRRAAEPGRRGRRGLGRPPRARRATAGIARAGPGRRRGRAAARLHPPARRPAPSRPGDASSTPGSRSRSATNAESGLGDERERGALPLARLPGERAHPAARRSGRPPGEAPVRCGSRTRDGSPSGRPRTSSSGARVTPAHLCWHAGVNHVAVCVVTATAGWCHEAAASRGLPRGLRLTPPADARTVRDVPPLRTALRPPTGRPPCRSAAPRTRCEPSPTSTRTAGASPGTARAAPGSAAG